MKASELHKKLGDSIEELGDHDIYIQQFDDDMLLTLVLNELKTLASVCFFELKNGMKFFYITTKKEPPLQNHFILDRENITSSTDYRLPNESE